MTQEEADRQKRIKKIESFTSESVITSQPSGILSECELTDDFVDSNIKLSTEAHIKRKLFRKVVLRLRSNPKHYFRDIGNHH